MESPDTNYSPDFCDSDVSIQKQLVSKASSKRSPRSQNTTPFSGHSSNGDNNDSDISELQSVSSLSNHSFESGGRKRKDDYTPFSGDENDSHARTYNKTPDKIDRKITPVSIQESLSRGDLPRNRCFTADSGRKDRDSMSIVSAEDIDYTSTRSPGSWKGEKDNIYLAVTKPSVSSSSCNSKSGRRNSVVSTHGSRNSKLSSCSSTNNKKNTDNQSSRFSALSPCSSNRSDRTYKVDQSPISVTTDRTNKMVKSPVFTTSGRTLDKPSVSARSGRSEGQSLLSVTSDRTYNSQFSWRSDKTSVSGRSDHTVDRSQTSTRTDCTFKVDISPYSDRSYSTDENSQIYKASVSSDNQSPVSARSNYTYSVGNSPVSGQRGASLSSSHNSVGNVRKTSDMFAREHTPSPSNNDVSSITNERKMNKYPNSLSANKSVTPIKSSRGSSSYVKDKNSPFSVGESYSAISGIGVSSRSKNRTMDYHLPVSDDDIVSVNSKRSSQASVGSRVRKMRKNSPVSDDDSASVASNRSSRASSRRAERKTKSPDSDGNVIVTSGKSSRASPGWSDRKIDNKPPVSDNEKVNVTSDRSSRASSERSKRKKDKKSPVSGSDTSNATSDNSRDLSRRSMRKKDKKPPISHGETYSMTSVVSSRSASLTDDENLSEKPVISRQGRVGRIQSNRSHVDRQVEGKTMGTMSVSTGYTSNNSPTTDCNESQEVQKTHSIKVKSDEKNKYSKNNKNKLTKEEAIFSQSSLKLNDLLNKIFPDKSENENSKIGNSKQLDSTETSLAKVTDKNKPTEVSKRAVDRGKKCVSVQPKGNNIDANLSSTKEPGNTRKVKSDQTNTDSDLEKNSKRTVETNSRSVLSKTSAAGKDSHDKTSQSSTANNINAKTIKPKKARSSLQSDQHNGRVKPSLQLNKCRETNTTSVCKEVAEIKLPTVKHTKASDSKQKQISTCGIKNQHNGCVQLPSIDNQLKGHVQLPSINNQQNGHKQDLNECNRKTNVASNKSFMLPGIQMKTTVTNVPGKISIIRSNQGQTQINNKLESVKKSSVPVTLKSCAVYHDGKINVHLKHGGRQIINPKDVSVQISVTHLHKKQRKQKSAPQSYHPGSTFEFEYTDREIIGHRATKPPFNTYTDVDASERHYRLFNDRPESTTKFNY